MPYLQPRNTPLRLTFIVCSQTASSVSTAPPSSRWEMPALLNSTSRRPNASSAPAIIRRQSRASETSARAKMARPPVSAIMAAVSEPAQSSMSTAATAAPSRAKRSAVWRPIPLPAPVISADFPASLMRNARLSFCDF